MKRRLITVFSIGVLLIFGIAACQGGAPEGDAPPVEGRGAPVQEVRLSPEPDSAAAERFREAMRFAREASLHERPIGEVMQALGERFEGEPYVVGPLDGTDEEVLVCRLDGFDCYTFVDAIFALARGVKEQDYSYATYARHTRDQRYRRGEMGDYCSRLHYFSEWIADNERRGNLRHITREIGGEPMEKQLNFMTEHRERYPRFAEDDDVYQCIQEMEAQVADLEHYYVPQDRIREVYDELQAGDIVAFATDIEGLDVTHTGLVYDHGDGQKGLLHASTEEGVTIASDLQSYVQGNDRQIGIVVARPQPVAQVE